MKIPQELQKAHDRIAQFASRVVMHYEDESVDLDITDKWQNIAPSVESIQCALNGQDCTVLNVTFSEGGVIDKHTHDRQEHIFVVAGSLTIDMYPINDPDADPETYHINEGTRFIIPKDTPHRVYSDYAKLTVVFRPPFMRVSIAS